MRCLEQVGENNIRRAKIELMQEMRKRILMRREQISKEKRIWILRRKGIGFLRS